MFGYNLFDIEIYSQIIYIFLKLTKVSEIFFIFFFYRHFFLSFSAGGSLRRSLSKTKTCKTVKKALKKIKMKWFSIDFKFNSPFNGLLGPIFCYKNLCTKNVQKIFCLKYFVRYYNSENGKRKTSHVILIFIFFYFFDNDNRIHIQHISWVVIG